MKQQRLKQFFDRIYIVHLPERVDRFRALGRELGHIGIAIDGPQVRIPFAPRASEANGFKSKGVYGNFLSHLGILQEMWRDGLETVWVLEDDAIFKRRLSKDSVQAEITGILSTTPWDLCYLGHSLREELRALPVGLAPFGGPFIWAHCYAVHRRVLPRLIDYMEQSLVKPPGHPDGGRLYIDAAFNLFRQFNPDVITLVSNPCLSVQKGSPSSLADGHWYDQNAMTRVATSCARLIRDEYWRRSG